MAYKSLLNQGTPAKSSGGGYQSIFGFATRRGMTPEEQKKRDAAYKLAALQSQAAEADKAVAQQAHQGIIGDFRQHGVEAAKEAVPIVAKGAIQSPEIVARGITRALPGGTNDLAAAAEASNQQSATISEIASRINNKNTPASEKKHLQLLLDHLNQDKAPAQALQDTVKQIKSDTDKRKFLAATGDILLTVAAPSSVAALKGLGIVGGTALGVAEGAAGGTFQSLEGDNPTLGGTLKSAAIGGTIGGFSAGAGKFVESTLKKAENFARDTATQELLKVNDGIKEPITDAAHLLPAQTASREAELTGRLDEINQRLDEIKTGKGSNTSYTQKLPNKDNLGSSPTATTTPRITSAGTPDARTTAAKRQGTVTPTTSTAKSVTGAEVRALNKERRAIAAELENAKRVAPISQLDDVNRRINEAQASKATTPQEALALKQERDNIQQKIATTSPPEIKKTANDMNTVMNVHQNSGEAFTPTAAQRTEAYAVANKLAGKEGFDNLPVAERVSNINEAATAVGLSHSDPQQLIDAAMGGPEIPGVRSSVAYEAAKTYAVKQGDAELIQQLAGSPVAKRGTEAGQFAAGFATKDPESPVDIIQKLNKIRGESGNPKVPKFVSQGEAEHITTMAQDVAQKKEALLADVNNPKLQQAYGEASVKLTNYADMLGAEATKRGVKQTLKEEGVIGTAKSGIENIGAASKVLRTAVDIGTTFRQGVKVFWTHPKVWAKGSLKSIEAFGKTIAGKDMESGLKAALISRPNTLNGKYKDYGIQLFGVTEEAFPTKRLESLPFIGRVIKASDTSYTAALELWRANIADIEIAAAEKMGAVKTLADKKAVGDVVNSLTSRGYLKKGHPLTNKIFFSPAQMKSHFDVLTAHAFQHGATTYSKKLAAKNLLKIAVGTGATLALAEHIKPGSVEWDPRSSNFGTIKVGNTRFDVTGGMKSVATLATRFGATMVGQKGYKSSVTGDVTGLLDKGFGKQSLLDVTEGFFENKFAPGPALIRDLLSPETFSGENPRTPGYIAKSLFTPLSIANYEELKNDPKSANKLVALIADGLGISTNTYGPKQPDWRNSTSKELQQFKQAVPEQKFLEANDKYNQRYTDWLSKVEKNPKYMKLNADDRSTIRTNKQSEIKSKVLKEYQFTYKRESNNSLKGF